MVLKYNWELRDQFYSNQGFLRKEKKILSWEERIKEVYEWFNLFRTIFCWRVPAPHCIYWRGHRSHSFHWASTKSGWPCSGMQSCLGFRLDADLKPIVCECNGSRLKVKERLVVANREPHYGEKISIKRFEAVHQN